MSYVLKLSEQVVIQSNNEAESLKQPSKSRRVETQYIEETNFAADDNTPVTRSDLAPLQKQISDMEETIRVMQKTVKLQVKHQGTLRCAECLNEITDDSEPFGGANGMTIDTGTALHRSSTQEPCIDPSLLELGQCSRLDSPSAGPTFIIDQQDASEDTLGSDGQTRRKANTSAIDSGYGSTD